MSLYTDLALEVKEMDPEAGGIKEEHYSIHGVELTRIAIETDEAARRMGKRKGNYITIDAPQLIDRTKEAFESVTGTIKDELEDLLKIKSGDGPILIVGLGNRSVTPDSLGPIVADKVIVTKHINEKEPMLFENRIVSVCSIAPGVMGMTGVETADFVKGIAAIINPSAIIAVDSLASRRASRLGTTIQLSDTGISPGAGVGNMREGMNYDTVGIPVIAVGVPLVVYASTISRDAVSAMAKEAGIDEGEEKLKELIGRITDEQMEGLIVTPKEIDKMVSDMSEVLACGINKALFRDDYEELKNLML